MDRSRFTTFAEALDEGGAPAALDRLAETLRAERKLPQLFEALLMKKRHALGLPLQGNESLRDLPEELQGSLEESYIEVCRTVGGLFLEEGDIAGAWPYFRAIDETEKVADALERWRPRTDGDDPGEDALNECDTIVDIAFNQGAHPERGFELILSEYGTCRAITIFEHQFPYAGRVRESCGGRLVRHLYQELLESLKSDIERHGEEVPEGATVRNLIEDRPWLFEEHGYHIDISHLQAVVRGAAALEGREELDLALQMCEYGRRLSREFQMNERPPFDDFYNDYRILLRAFLGEGVDGAVRYFRAKADRAGIDENGQHFPGEVVVYLLHRTGRRREAIEAYLEYLKDVQGPLSIAPSLFQLSEEAGDFRSLLDLSAEKEDLLQYAAGLIRRRELETGGNERN